MKAVVLTQYGEARRAFALKEWPEPVTGPGEVKIKVEAFGLNFADVMARKKLYKPAPAAPSVLGYEVVGTVTEQGKDVRTNWVGRRVVAFTRFGGYAQVAVTSQQAVVEITHADDAGNMLALATQYCTAYYAAYNVTTLNAGDVVLQHAAAGGVGTALTQLARLRGATVIGLTGSDNKLDYLRANGCHDAVNYTKTNYAEYVKKKYGGIDAGFNSVAGSTFKKDLALLKPGGKLVCYGAAERLGGKWGIFSTIGLVLKMGRIIPVKLLMKSQSLIGINMLQIADNRPDVLQACMQEVYALYTQGKIKPHIGASYPVSDIVKAHELFEQGKTTGKLVISWG